MLKRNQNSMFAINPTSLDRPRSVFNRNSSNKLSFNAGQVIPVFCDEVYPGDTHNMDTNVLLRTSSPLVVPTMDDMFLDVYYFFVPGRLTWSHWVEFFGENTQGAWVPTTTYTIPQITSPAEVGWKVGSLADYFGVPTGVPNLSINALPFRAYCLIINDFFRDQNLQDPLHYNLDDATVVGVNDIAQEDILTNVVLGGCPARANKFHDYFTSCLPSAQKGPAVPLPIGDASFDNVPVNALPTEHDINYGMLKWKVSGSVPTGTYHNVTVGASPTGSFDSYINDSSVPAGNHALVPSNLYAFGSDIPFSTNATINDLRDAFQLQKYYEALARGGSRYPEWLKVMFGVTSPDARQQRPEYLGGNRIRIGINSVTQTSASQDTQYQGRQSAYSVTMDSDHSFIKSFTEHGYLIGVAIVRYKHSYQYGLNRMWSRREVTDFYNPVFANVGEQPVLNKEIYAQGTDVDDEVFGYQEAWADLRYKPNQICGEMRSQYESSLDVWHLADDYSSLPHLSADFMAEDKASIDRVLYVNSSISNQFIADFYFSDKTTRVLPLYSIPGLIDHH